MPARTARKGSDDVLAEMRPSFRTGPVPALPRPSSLERAELRAGGVPTPCHPSSPTASFIPSKTSSSPGLIRCEARGYCLIVWGRRMASEAGLGSDERPLQGNAKEGGRSDIREFSLKMTPSEGIPSSGRRVCSSANLRGHAQDTQSPRSGGIFRRPELPSSEDALRAVPAGAGERPREDASRAPLFILRRSGGP